MIESSFVPWLTGVLTLLFAVTIWILLVSWREAKRSPFFFLRRQAQKRMQTSAMFGVVLLVLNLGAVTYMRQVEPISAPLTALIADAKPAEATTTADLQPIEDVAVAFDATSAPAARSSAETELLPLETLAPIDEAPQVLPTEFDLVTAEAELSDETRLGTIDFATRMDDEFKAVAPERIFEEGYFTIYATFSYEGMADGMAWAWVWRYNGDVVSGGNELWAYGDDGPGYIFLEPEEGFIPGEYDLQIWVNGELLTDARMFVTATVAANQ